ncbi:hypothetical protein LNKW23_06380 [Paralimibaculum aggregatum]|uniref:Peptidase metallopeptidase domain-containing protein n=1 Tax=Paralimibaculum aggregatum TaxID=3036245 RepID=A0ABQ6LGS6_9RHOB|nr:DUF4214 domain-containing protein [Limibaculum sp. NKW23]GMG81425.1 hypothetical protein LNKW23_06380 [Limibaculum sp. NKW23]
MCFFCSMYTGDCDFSVAAVASAALAATGGNGDPGVGIATFSGTLVRLPPGGFGERPLDEEPEPPIGKWGDDAPGTPGGTVSWSIAGGGLAVPGLAEGQFTIDPDAAYDFELEPILENVFAQWSSVADIEFEQVEDDGAPLTGPSSADIRISLADTQVIGALGYAYFPQVGEVVMDANLEDVVDDYEAETAGELFFAIVLHEVGHALGLEHTDVFTAVMAAGNFLTPTELQPDDINNIQAIYGAQDDDIEVPPIDPSLTPEPQLFAAPVELVGNSEANALTADNGDDTLRGGQGNDTLDGGAGNDLIEGGGGNDLMEGNAGLDTALFSGNYGPSRLAFTDDGLLVRGDDSRLDTLNGIERLAFDNGILALDLPGSELGYVYRLYTAAFGREADAGLLYWQEALSEGMTRLDLAEAFVMSDEFGDRYGVPDDEDFIDALYLNVLGREAEDKGHDFWLDAFAEGTSRAEMLVYFTESGENVAAAAAELENGLFFEGAVLG